MAAVLLCILGLAAITHTHRTFSAVFDEPAHLAAGLEWLSEGSYTLETQHPPLARITAAAGPWLQGARTNVAYTELFSEGRRILGRGAEYRDTLATARRGMLPWFAFLCWGVWAWGRHAGGRAAGAIAVGLTVANPNLLAHAGFATLDLAVTTGVTLTAVAWARWLEMPTRVRAALVGVGVAVAATTKFSGAAYLVVALPMAAVLAAAGRYDRQGELGPARWPSVARDAMLALGVAVLAVWAVYRFDTGPVGGSTIPLPAPALFDGIGRFLSHGTGGHPSFLFGETRMSGWWYYYVVALLVKTPIPLLLLVGVGLAVAVRGLAGDAASGARPAVCTALAVVGAVLLVSALTRVDIGIRHVLPLYPALAVLGSVGTVALWRRGRPMRATVVALALASAVIPIRAHPDHIAYFNVLAGPRPETVLSDSNIDWGQDLYRLASITAGLRLDTLHVAYFGSTFPQQIPVPNTLSLGPGDRATGWVAISETLAAGLWYDTSFAWVLRGEPVMRVGRSIRLYRVEPDRPGR